MKTANEQRGLFSRLPEEREYWQGLTDRIAADGAVHLASFSDRGGEWWSVIARFSTLLAAGAAAAVVGFFLLIPGADPNTVRRGTVDAYGLAPPDPLAITLISQDTPPSMEALIAMRNAELER
jgi:hypothetical protein